MNSWFKFYREMRDHWIWKDPEKLRAWLELLILANWETRKVNLGRRLIDVNRGQFIASKRKLAEKWGWSRERADAFFTLLESDKMIVQTPGQSFTMITICNYDLYQDNDKADQSTNVATDQATDQATPQPPTRPLPSTTKNSKKDKELKEPKNKYGNVLLKLSELERLKTRFGIEKARAYVRFLSLHIESKGVDWWRKTYKSDYACILKWVVSAVDEQESRDAQTAERENRLGTSVGGFATDPLSIAAAEAAARKVLS